MNLSSHLIFGCWALGMWFLLPLNTGSMCSVALSSLSPGWASVSGLALECSLCHSKARITYHVHALAICGQPWQVSTLNPFHTANEIRQCVIQLSKPLPLQMMGDVFTLPSLANEAFREMINSMEHWDRSLLNDCCIQEGEVVSAAVGST